MCTQQRIVTLCVGNQSMAPITSWYHVEDFKYNLFWEGERITFLIEFLGHIHIFLPLYLLVTWLG